MAESELGRTYEDGEVIFKEGESGDTMFVIQSGKVRITRKGPTKDVVIATLDKGEIFGEMALFDKMPRSAKAVAYGKARVLTVDKKKLFSTISRDPTIVLKILESMSKRIRNLNEHLTMLDQANKDLAHLFIGVDETSRIVLDEAKNVIKADRGSVMLLADDRKSLAIKAAFGLEAERKAPLAVGVGIAGSVMQSGKAELVNNVSLDSRFQKGGADIRSMLCVPLKIGDKVFGVINMSNGGDKLFTIDDLKLLCSLSVYAAVAVQSSKNFSSLHSAANHVLTTATIIT